MKAESAVPQIILLATPRFHSVYNHSKEPERAFPRALLFGRLGSQQDLDDVPMVLGGCALPKVQSPD